MTTKLRNPLVYELLKIAQEEVARRPFRQVGLRRAVSSAYYAVFHALCFICADELVGWSKTSSISRIYRSLDHGEARKRLAAAQAKRIDSTLAQIGSLFEILQDQRQLADYSPPGKIFSRDEALGLLDQARQAISLVEALDKTVRLETAILLIARPRSGQRRNAIARQTHHRRMRVGPKGAIAVEGSST